MAFHHAGVTESNQYASIIEEIAEDKNYWAYHPTQLIINGWSY